ncbi:MAG TPA: hypothetical protein VGB59_12865 [Allosphingosinicella sp.]|jgi:hypothetical protein
MAEKIVELSAKETETVSGSAGGGYITASGAAPDASPPSTDSRGGGYITSTG